MKNFRNKTAKIIEGMYFVKIFTKFTNLYIVCHRHEKLNKCCSFMKLVKQFLVYFRVGRC